jgi:sialate O-acetylesterase
MKNSFLFLLLLALSSLAKAEVSLPLLFGDHMVLQRDQPIPIWGWAKAGEVVSVRFNSQTKSTKADKQGRWMVKLDPEKAGGPFLLLVSAKNVIQINDVLVGEVWICSGQSNMEMPIAGWGKIKNYQGEIADADYPEIRHFKVPLTVSLVPKDNIESGAWKVCSPATAGDFTAVGYFFARELYRKLHVPIGLLNTSWGGTMIETWISRGAFEQSEEFKSMASQISPEGPAPSATQSLSKLKKTIEGLQGPDAKTRDSVSWRHADFDDSQWPKMKLPGAWEGQGLGLEDLDGVVWFRKVITLSPEDAGKPAVLELGKIDDSDDSYLNGSKVGGLKNQYDENRHYPIPAGLLRAGKNLIAVRVEDTGGDGGIYGEPGALKLTIGTKEIPLAGDWSFYIDSVYSFVRTGANSYPDLLFNAMINPLLPYAIKGALWYQGETNASRAYQYRKALPLMITDWRSHWQQGDFPFYIVQLASWRASNGNSQNGGSTWAELREAQAMTLSLPSTGMAVTLDIGDSVDIHPKDKQDVGKRLAAIALNNLYGLPMEYSGPVFQSMKVNGQKVILTFTHASEGFIVRDKYGYLKGFEVAGADQKFYYAKASIEGNTVVVWQDDVTSPVAVRYGWADYAPDANLYNKAGLPAVPFRTDQWKGVTEGVKYEIGK